MRQMNIIKRLPSHLARHVYSYDDTYRKIYAAVKNSINRLKYRGRTYFYDYTLYPEIFAHTYWGRFCDLKKGLLVNTGPCPRIVHNRNRFVKEYGIVRYKKPSRNLSTEILVTGTDHNEYYQDTCGNYVHLFSVYGDGVEIEDSSYEWIYPLYTNNSTTFVKHLPRLKPPKQKRSRHNK